MRIPLNKALTTSTKEEKNPSTVGLHPGKADSMNKEIKKVMDAAEELAKVNPETRAQYLKGIADAQDARKAATQAKEEAETVALEEQEYAELVRHEKNPNVPEQIVPDEI